MSPLAPGRRRSESSASSGYETPDEDGGDSTCGPIPSKNPSGRKRKGVPRQGVAYSLPRQPFNTLIKEICHEIDRGEYLFSREAKDILQEASESYLEDVFRESQRWVDHDQRVTLEVKDMKAALSGASRLAVDDRLSRLEGIV